MKAPALFLDRDGVINVDRGYVYEKSEFEFIDGIFDLCRTATDLGYSIFVITNQSGIGRGYYAEEDFRSLTEWMLDVFANADIHVDKVYFCPFHPHSGLRRYRRDSPLRKPRPGMILQAAAEFDVDLPASVLVGDKESDVRAGVAAGVGCNLLFAPGGAPDPDATVATAVIRSHAEAGAFLRESSPPTRVSSMGA